MYTLSLASLAFNEISFTYQKKNVLYTLSHMKPLFLGLYMD